MAFNERIRELREENKMTQQEMADVLGVSKSAYVKYERGERQPKHGVLMAIADYFDVSVDFVLGTSDEKNKYVKQTTAYIQYVSELCENIYSRDFIEEHGEEMSKSIQKMVADYLSSLAQPLSARMIDMLFIIVELNELLWEIYWDSSRAFHLFDDAEKDDEDTYQLKTEDYREFVEKVCNLNALINIRMQTMTTKAFHEAHQNYQSYLGDEIVYYAHVDKKEIERRIKSWPEYSYEHKDSDEKNDE